MQLGCDAFRRAAVSRGLSVANFPPALVRCPREDILNVTSTRPEQTIETRQKYYGSRYQLQRSGNGITKSTQTTLSLPTLRSSEKELSNTLSRYTLSSGQLLQCPHVDRTQSLHKKILHVSSRQRTLHSIGSFRIIHTSTVHYPQSSAIQDAVDTYEEDTSQLHHSRMWKAIDREPTTLRNTPKLSTNSPVNDKHLEISARPDIQDSVQEGTEGIYFVKDPSNLLRVTRAAKSKAIWKNDKLQIQRARNSTKGSMVVDWKSILNVLLRETPRVRAGERALILRGDPLELQRIYEEIRSAPTIRLVANAPHSLGNEWFGRISGPEDELKAIEERISKLGEVYIQDQATEKVPEAFDLFAQVKTITRPDVRAYASFDRISKAAKALEQLFEHKTVNQLCLPAFDLSLRFLFRHQQTPAARRLLGKWKELGQASTVSSYNLFLQYLARDQNLYGFFFVLTRLIREGLTPTWETWLAAFPLIPSIVAMRHFAGEMHSRGYMKHTSAAHFTPRYIIGYSFAPFLDQGGSVDSYLDTLDALYGKVWHSEISLHQLLDALGERGRIEEAVEVLKDFVTKRNYVCQAIDLNVMFGYCKRHLNADTAVALMEYSHRTWNVKPDRDTYPMLFSTFRKARMYNCCRVVWKYACMAGQTDYLMRTKILRSLRSDPNNDGSVLQQWKNSFGAVVCGRQVEASFNRVVIGREILEEELNLHGNIPHKPFAQALVDGLSLDKQWNKEGLRRQKDTPKKMKNAISISFTTKGPPARRLIPSLPDIQYLYPPADETPLDNE